MEQIETFPSFFISVLLQLCSSGCSVEWFRSIMLLNVYMFIFS